MNKLKKGKMEKGITLVALIITIIVLLILAVVAIGAVQNDGIIEYAKSARDKYEKKANEEQELLSKIEGVLAENAGPWVQNKTKVMNMKTGKTLEVGDKVNYTPGEGSTYTGAWGVLGAENGELLIMTREDVESNYRLEYPDYWNWDVETKSYKKIADNLDKICENKVKIAGTKATKVRSVKVEDINRVTGFDPTNVNGAPYGSGKVYQYGNTVRYYLNNGKVAYESKAPDGTVTKSATTSGYSKFGLPNYRMLVTSGEEATGFFTGVDEVEITSDSYYYDGYKCLKDNRKAQSFLVDTRHMAGTGEALR